VARTASAVAGAGRDVVGAAVVVGVAGAPDPGADVAGADDDEDGAEVLGAVVGPGVVVVPGSSSLHAAMPATSTSGASNRAARRGRCDRPAGASVGPGACRRFIGLPFG
jgi:hypothetical protein